MNIKLLGKVFLSYFGLFGLLIAATWIKFIYNVSSLGGEMADTIFLLGLLFVTCYFYLLTVWTYKLSKAQDTFGVRLQLSLIFLFGICFSLVGLFYLLHL